MAKRKPPLALCYDFDGTLAHGNMQETSFIPKIGMTKKAFWTEVSARSKTHQADNILMYMWLMLEKAAEAKVPVHKSDFLNHGKEVKLFNGVVDWFERINTYAKAGGVNVSHHIISSGTKEMILGSPISKYFENVFASSYCFDHNDVAVWPALSINYTYKTQFLFRINKGVHDVFDHSVINAYVPPEERPVPFENMVYLGDGETDVPCFRLVKQQGGHSIAVFPPHKKGAKEKAERLRADGRVNFVALADYSEGSSLDKKVKAIIDKIAIDAHLYSGQ